MDVLTFIVIVLVIYVVYILNNKNNNNSNGGRSEIDPKKRNAILNNYHTLAEVEAALRKAGLESSDLILAVDFTRSNTWQGEKSFQGKNLHALSKEVRNPYQQVIATMSDVLIKKLDDDCVVPLYGFGDSLTGNRKVFLLNNEKPCRSKEELLAAYEDVASNVTLSGPTSFAPIIREAIDVVKSTGKYHILVIIADGAMDDVNETTKAIVEASKYPLSIVTVGVGDGPWDQMETFDDAIPSRQFDNFQFVCFTDLLLAYPDPNQRAMSFALESLMELPDQYKLIKQFGLLGNAADRNVNFNNRLRGKHHFPSSFQRQEGRTLSPPPYSH